MSYLKLEVLKMKISKGFTLIELLIVIAILGVLAAGVLIAVDPVDRINSANDSRVQSDVGVIGRAAEAYAATNNGFYPGANAIGVGGDLVSNGDLKSAPTAPSGYTYTVVNVPPGCTAGSTCTAIYIFGGELKSKKFGAGTPYWRYGSNDGKSCKVTSATDTTTACP